MRILPSARHRIATVGVALVAVGMVAAPVPAATAERTAADDGSALVTRSGSQLLLDGHPFRFGAANEYWLGLDENVGGIDYPTDFRIRDGLQTAKDMGATVIRAHTLGVSTALPRSVEPALGQFNEAAFRTIDYSIYQARRIGLHLLVPLTDNWHWYHGGKHDFTDWLGLPEDAFYTDPAAIAAFEDFSAHLLNHVNAYTGVALKDDPTIMAWELGNELNGMAGSWINTICAYLKELSPQHLVSVNQQSGINPASLTAPDADIIDVHYYPPSTSQIEADAATVAAAHKVYFAGEYGSVSASSSLLMPSWLTATSPARRSGRCSRIATTTDTSSTPTASRCTIPATTDAMRAQAEAIRDFAWAMTQSVSGGPNRVPPVPAPGRPLITSLTPSATGTAIAWRGATTASDYTVQRSTAGTRGPWLTVCDRCATDNDTPWTDATAPSGTAWYRVIPFTAEGTAGQPSPPAMTP